MWALSGSCLRVSAVYTGWGLRRRWAARSTPVCLKQSLVFPESGMWAKGLLFEEEAGTNALSRLFHLCTPVTGCGIGSHVSDGSVCAGSLIFTLRMCSNLSFAKPRQCRCRYSFFFKLQILRLSRAKWCTQDGTSRKRLQRHQLPNPWSFTAQHSLSVNSFQESSGKWSKAKWNQNEMFLQS